MTLGQEAIGPLQLHSAVFTVPHRLLSGGTWAEPFIHTVAQSWGVLRAQVRAVAQLARVVGVLQPLRSRAQFLALARRCAFARLTVQACAPTRG